MSQTAELRASPVIDVVVAFALVLVVWAGVHTYWSVLELIHPLH